MYVKAYPDRKAAQPNKGSGQPPQLGYKIIHGTIAEVEEMVNAMQIRGWVTLGVPATSIPQDESLFDVSVVVHMVLK